MPEAPLDDSGSGPAQASGGGFVVNVRDAMWLTLGTRGSLCELEGQEGEFLQLGLRLHVLEPGSLPGSLNLHRARAGDTPEPRARRRVV